MAKFLLEIFCEETPARMQTRAGADLAKAITDGLKAAGLSVDKPVSFYGPRRLTFAADIPLRSPDISEERKGPRVGSPEQALAGFMRGAGLTDISQAEIRSDKKGEHYVAVIEKEGRDASDIIADLIPSVMNNFPWPKSMKSGGSNFRWVRPLQSILCLLDGDVVDFEVGGVKSGNATEGHRRHGKGPFTITSLSDYQKTLEDKGHVILDADKRKALILEKARAVCGAKGLELVEDPGLLDEVAGLAEWPVVILGDMDPSFLELPGEVIRLSMRTHQKYFAVRDPKTGGLAPNFVMVANQIAPDGGTAIAEGNSRVLSARLGDAQFFQQEDAKKKLIDYYDKLGTVVFHKKLGSIKDKAERVAALARDLAPKVGADPDKAEAAAKLAKCDLVMQTVVEFTSLQGQIGRLMYEAEYLNSAHPGESRGPESQTPESDALGPRFRGDERWGESDHQDIAIAIEDHYKPQGPSDSVPTNPVAVAVALADKLDTLVGFWAIDEKPTGSKDPYALRRAALGVVRCVLENRIRLSFDETISLTFPALLADIDKEDFIYKTDPLIDAANLGGITSKEFDKLYEKKLKSYEDGAYYWSSKEGHNHIISLHSDLFAFIADRLKVYLRDKGIRHDLIDAVFALGEDDLVAIVNRVEALQSFLSTDDGTDLLAGYKRAANILKAEAKTGDLPDGVPSEGTQKEETALFTSLSKVTPKIEAALGKEDYSKAMSELATLRGPIDAFFDKVTVNSDDSKERQNRLRLLGQIRDTARTIADFDAIDG